jgi:hypothetical protein
VELGRSDYLSKVKESFSRLGAVMEQPAPATEPTAMETSK